MNLQTLDDLSRICHDEASLEYVAPDEEGRQILLPSFFRSAIRAGELYGEIHMSENGDGVAVWIRPEHHLAFRQMVITELSEPYSARYMKLRQSIEEVRTRLAPGPHWYLMLLAVTPSLPEKVVAEALMQPVLSRADSTGMPCYLETFSEKRLAFYEDRGFRITGAGRIGASGPNFWTMGRTAR